MSIYVSDLAQYVIRPVLKVVNLYSMEAEQLLLGTAAVESLLGSYLHQSEGPALGIYQMEPETHHDIYANYLNARPELKNAILQACDYPAIPSDSALLSNLAYASLMTRIKYLRCSDTLPGVNKIYDMSKYWKENYNTCNGAGEASNFVSNYMRYVNLFYTNK